VRKSVKVAGVVLRELFKEPRRIQLPGVGVPFPLVGLKLYGLKRAFLFDEQQLCCVNFIHLPFDIAFISGEADKEFCAQSLAPHACF
jgi:hypothetical protein